MRAVWSGLAPQNLVTPRCCSRDALNAPDPEMKEAAPAPRPPPAWLGSGRSLPCVSLAGVPKNTDYCNGTAIAAKCVIAHT